MSFEDHASFSANFTPSPGATATRDAPPSQTYHHEEHLRDNEALQVKLADRIQDLGTRIASAEQFLRDAVSEKRVLETRLQVLKLEAAVQQRAFSPARMLPQEMLGAVFLHLHTALTQRELCGLCDFDAARAVVAVARVSRAWRAAAVATHGLWSRIEFAFYNLNNSQKAGAWLVYLRTHLARSRAHPLTFNIAACNPESIAFGPGQIAFGAILDALPRCVKFSLCTDSFGTGEGYLPLEFQQPMPLLEEFQLLQELNDNEREPHAELAEYVHFLPHAPRLRILKLDAGILHCVTFARLPALVELHIDAHYKQLCPAGLFRLLTLCHQVKKLTVGPDYRDSDALVAGQPAPVLTLPNLTDLVINGTVALFSDIAPMLSCPALRNLEINALYNGLPDELQVIESLICTNITSLYIYSFESDGDGALASILRTLPHLRELEICQMALFGVDLAPLCAPDERTGQWIAPRLQQINFESILNYDGDAVVQLLKFVDARTAAGASELDNSPVWPLRKVNVCAHREKIGSVPSWVQDTINRFLNRVVGDVTSSGATCR